MTLIYKIDAGSGHIPKLFLNWRTRVEVIKYDNDRN